MSSDIQAYWVLVKIQYQASLLESAVRLSEHVSKRRSKQQREMGVFPHVARV